MSTEFCFTRHCTDRNFSNLDSNFNVEAVSTGILLSRKHSNIVKSDHEKYTAYLIGDIYNISILKSTLGKIEGNVWAINDAEVLCLMREKLGDSAISLAEGDFCLFIEHHNGVIEVVTESRGLNLISVVKTERLWITNSLKMVGRLEGEHAFDFRPEQEIIYDSLKADNFSPIRNVSRLKPGTINKIVYDEQNYPYIESKQLTASTETSILKLQESTLHELIDMDLRYSISRLVDNNESIGIPLSGGLDSSLVTALACQYFKKVKTWSIGTELSNEFEFSKIVSDTLGTEHEVKILSEDEIISGVVKAIYHNEIFDGLSSEIQSGLFNVYELAQGKVNSLLTGYGSDLLFGGILNPSESYQNPNSILSEQVYRTKWTGEFSTQGSKSYGLNVYHPFWNNNLISLCHNLDPNFKIRDNEVKNILREYTDSLNILPKEIVWRKKIGIHEGSSVNKSFANIIGTSVNNYQEKTRFSYAIYKEFLTGRLSIDEASPAKLRDIIKRN
ncbi:asparagine synthase family protein [Serratia plymuthica]|uniref:asparagine synthase family protein n=1 Tax=Serratia plymuthica TaxID=82996 RepID=UPI0018D6C8DC|nr:asparagine synthetase B family protein [Serratia plymuthica]QPS57341.1 asparagine synthase [Serratia plymuthica]